MTRHQPGLRMATFLLIFVVLAVSFVPALAQVAPKLTLAPVWRPGIQLDTLSPTDIRYVDVELYLTGNVQFWAADFVCTVKGTLLTDYAWDNAAATGDPGDDMSMVRWGGDWGAEGTDYISFPASGAYTSTANGTANGGNGYVDATGQLNFSATRLGSVNPLGQNGVTYNMLLASLRFRVAEFVAPKVSDTSAFACSVVQILDRNGNKIATTAVTAPPMLSVVDGYTISGTVQYQKLTAHTGIGIDCDLIPGTPDPITVAANGVFTHTTRVLGNYTCLFYGNKSNTSAGQEEDVFLAGTTKFSLNDSSYALLPIVLKGGNADLIPTNIDVDDVLEVTGPGDWDKVTPAFTGGDVNGDGKVNELDLTIIGGNFGLSQNVDYSHMIFGLPRDFTVLNNSRIVYGGTQAGEVKPLVNTTTPAHWPMLAPNGAVVAFVKYDTPSKRYLLNTALTKTLPAATSTILTPAATFKEDAFAPSWSPDGQRIAFICATINPVSSGLVGAEGWSLNKGDLCVIDANGRNLRQLTFDDNVKIFPPAWFDNNLLIFAGTTDNTTCADDLCFYDFARNAFGVVDTDLAVSPNVAHMPVIQRQGTSVYLFYRFDDPTEKKIRVATGLSYDGTNFSNIAAVPSPSHKDVALTVDGTPISTEVDYFDVSPQLNVVFYDFGSSTFQNSLYEGTFGDWAVPVSHNVDGFIGNPFWNENPTLETYLHALRATVDWVP